MYAPPLMYCRYCSIKEFGVDNYDFCSESTLTTTRAVVCRSCGPINVDRFGSKVSVNMNLPALPAPNKPIPSFFADAILPVPNEDAGPWVVKNEELLRLPTGIYEVIHCTKIYGARTGWVLKVARGELIIPVHWSSSVSLAAIRSRMYDFILAARKDNLVRYMDKKECVFADRVRTGSHIVAVRELKGTTLQNLLPRIHTRTRTPVL